MDDLEKLRMEGLENGNKSLCQEINRLRERIAEIEDSKDRWRKAAFGLLRRIEKIEGAI